AFVSLGEGPLNQPSPGQTRQRQASDRHTSPNTLHTRKLNVTNTSRRRNRAQKVDAFSATTLVFDRYAVASDELTTAGNNLVGDPAPWLASAWTHRPVKGFRMLRFARAAAVVVFAGALTFAQFPTSVAAPFDSFIVVYKDSVDEPAKTADLKRRLGFNSDFQYQHVIKGFAAILPPQV